MRPRGTERTASRRRLRFVPLRATAKWDWCATCPLLIGRPVGSRVGCGGSPTGPRRVNPTWAWFTVGGGPHCRGRRLPLIHLRSPEHHGIRGRGARKRGSAMCSARGWLACSCTFCSRRKKIRFGLGCRIPAAPGTNSLFGVWAFSNHTFHMSSCSPVLLSHSTSFIAVACSSPIYQFRNHLKWFD